MSWGIDPTGRTSPSVDGPGVRRDLPSVPELVARQPALAGRLDPPRGGTPPRGVEVRTEADGTRVLTLNVHEGVPAGLELDGANQRLAGLRDTAPYVNAIDPDVVLVQELTHRRSGSFGADLEEQPSILAHLVEASDLAFTPAFDVAWGEGETGTAIITRNGYRIDRAVSAALPDGDATQPRGAAIALVQPPGDAEPIAVVGTHLAHGRDDHRSRKLQLEALARIVRDLADHGTFRSVPRVDAGFRWPWESTARSAAGFAADRIVVGGHLNTVQHHRFADGDAPGRILGRAGLDHVLDDLPRRDPATADATAAHPTTSRRRIDHLYVDGMRVTDVATAAVPSVELRERTAPTDHKGVVADLR